MKTEQHPHKLLLPTVFFITIVLMLGLFFRFYNLDYKVYWDDEAYTTLRIAGYTEAEVVQDFSLNRLSKVADIQKYTHFSSNKNIADTITALAKEEPQHPPLYFLLGKFWVMIFGDSVAGIRSFSAFTGVLALPAIYWLSMELFGSSIFGWTSVVILASSPFHVLYSQEAREYSLWTLAILVMSALFLRAVRLKGTFNWGAYASIVTLALYVYPLTALVAVGHGIYLIAVEGFRLSKLVLSNLLSLCLAFLLFLPWVLLILFNTQQIDKGMHFTHHLFTSPSSPLDVLREVLFSLKRVFMDDAIHVPLLSVCVYVLVGYAIYYLYRKAPTRVNLFLAMMIASGILLTVIPELLHIGGKTIQARYMIPMYLAIEIAIAYLFATQISRASTYLWLQRIWQFGLVAIVSLGIFSCAISSQSESAWTKIGYSGTFPELARIINQTPDSQIISDNYIIYPVALSNRLDPRVSWNIDPGCYLCNLPTSSEINPRLLQVSDKFSKTFLFAPSNQLIEKFDKTYKLTLVDKSVFKTLWEVKK